jgi:hypothetical protein
MAALLPRLPQDCSIACEKSNTFLGFAVGAAIAPIRITVPYEAILDIVPDVDTSTVVESNRFLPQ